MAMLSLPVMASHGSKDINKSHKGSKKKGSKDSKGSKNNHGSTDGVDDTQNCGVCDGKINTLSLQKSTPLPFNLHF